MDRLSILDIIDDPRYLDRLSLISLGEESGLYANMKPPFSYYGGKQRLAKRIVKLLPPHTVYVEPYCGSGAVYFKKGLPPSPNSSYYREVLNDTNGLIINFFRVMQNSALQTQLIERLQWTIYSQDDFRLAQKLCKNPSSDVIEMAWAWFCNINWGVSHRDKSGFGYAVLSAESATTHYNAVDRLKAYKNRLQRTTVFNEDALRVIERFDSPQTVFYIDPPYPDTNQGAYGGFTQQDFEDLITVLKTCKGSIVLSCYDNKIIPSDWIKYEFEAIASGKGVTGVNRNHTEKSNYRDDARRIECVWVKQASIEMREDLKIKALEHYNYFQSIS